MQINTLLTAYSKRADTRLKALFSNAVDGLFPHYCRLCGLRSWRDQPLCQACQSGLTANNECCHQCGLPLTRIHRMPDLPRGRHCGHCLTCPPAFDRVVAPWLYDEQMALLIHSWKFHGERNLSPLFAYLWLEQARPDISSIDLIVPVPLHWSKLWRRGFNQSLLFAAEVRRQSNTLRNVPLNPRLVQRHRPTSPQSGLGAVQRKTNLLAAFTARQRCDNLRVAIVDDVLTTGATATAMATTLRDAGAIHIEIWCLARTPEPKD